MSLAFNVSFSGATVQFLEEYRTAALLVTAHAYELEGARGRGVEESNLVPKVKAGG
jgi:hypothetical protein